MRAGLVVFAAVAACGRGGAGAPVPAPRDGGATRDAVAIELAPRALGMADLDGYGWRKRPGQLAFRAARKAEDREDWPRVADTCRAALAADPRHLEAAWLAAVALAKLGRLDEVEAPLAVAVAGDFGKWAQPSLDQPALQPFLATPTGAAWQRRVDQDRQLYAAALARALVVTAHGDLFAFDPGAGRWYRLTRTYGAVVGAFRVPVARRLVYVTRGRGAKPLAKLGVGMLDLTTGRTTRPAELGSSGPIRVAYSAGKPSGVYVRVGVSWQLLDDDGKLHAVPPPDRQRLGDTGWLDVTGRSARLDRRPPDHVNADWDDRGLASAIRIGTSNRVVAVPSPGLIDGNTALWSPDRAHLAFVAQLDDHCTPGAASAAAFVADAATGTVVELVRGSGGIAVEWLADRRLAIAGERGVSIVELGGAAPASVDGADGLVTPRRKPRCAPEPADEPVIDDEPPESGVGDEPRP